MNQQTNSLDYLANLTKAIDFNSFDSISELLIIIPCKNNANNIIETIEELKKRGSYHFLIIDDASNDNLEEICKSYNWNYIINNNSLGFDKIVRIGIDYAIENKYKYVMIFPGNGLYNSDDIAKLFFFAKKGYDIITTSRFIFNNKQSLKISDMKLLRNLFYLKTHQKVTDVTCPMKMFNWDVMQAYSENKKLAIDIASIAYMIKRFKMKLIEIPTHVSHNKNISKTNSDKWFKLKQLFKLIF